MAGITVENPVLTVTQMAVLAAGILAVTATVKLLFSLINLDKGSPFSGFKFYRGSNVIGRQRSVDWIKGLVIKTDKINLYELELLKFMSNSSN